MRTSRVRAVEFPSAISRDDIRRLGRRPAQGHPRAAWTGGVHGLWGGRTSVGGRSVGDTNHRVPDQPPEP